MEEEEKRENERRRKEKKDKEERELCSQTGKVNEERIIKKICSRAGCFYTHIVPD